MDKNIRIRYDYEYLNNFCIKNNLILCKDYCNEKINRNTRIIGNCINKDCKNTYDICFREFVKYNNFGCNICRKKITSKRRKQNCIDRYGVDHFMKVKEIKDKAHETFNNNYGNDYSSIVEKRKKTFKEILGVEYGSQDETIKQKIKNTIKEKYGVNHILQNKFFKEKARNTLIKNYGIDVPMKSEIIKNKVKLTCMEKYGFEHPMTSTEIKNKQIESCIKKYGVKYPLQNVIIKEKFEKTCRDRFGFKYPIQNENIKEKSIQTCLKKYGVEHPLQNEIIMEKASKNAYNMKEYIFPSGNIIKIQGYENYALDFLLEYQDILENDIITGCKNIPTIWYYDSNNKKHKHFVDIYIPSLNKCIEVKSTWTFKKNKDIVTLKQKAAKELGYNYEIWVFDEKANRVETIL